MHINLSLRIVSRVLGDTDLEYVHGMRRCTNRLRTGLREFPPVLDEAEHRQLVADAGWFVHSLGAVRDCDVSLQRLERMDFEEREDCAAGFAWVKSSVDKIRAERFRKLTADIKSARFAAYCDLLRKARTAQRRIMRKYAPRPGAVRRRLSVDERVSQRLPLIFARSVAVFLRRREKATRRFEQDRIHRLRLAGKKIRYLLDFFKVCRPRLYGATNKQLTLLHDTAGNMQDIVVLRELVDRCLADLSRRAPKKAESIRPGALRVLRRLSAQHRTQLDKYLNYWRMIHTEPFTSRCERLTQPWTYRSRRS